MYERRVVLKEQSMYDLADAIRAKAGLTKACTVDELVEIANHIGLPELEELTLTAAGTYIPTKYGFSKVIANIPVYKNFEEVEF
jgi:hypothetical protein